MFQNIPNKILTLMISLAARQCQQCCKDGSVSKSQQAYNGSLQIRSPYTDENQTQRNSLRSGELLKGKNS